MSPQGQNFQIFYPCEDRHTDINLNLEIIRLNEDPRAVFWAITKLLNYIPIQLALHR